jgi:tetrahydromethanopterin S-methyltransferase subunit B
MKNISLPQFITAFLKSYFYGFIVYLVFSLAFHSGTKINFELFNYELKEAILWIKSFYLSIKYVFEYNTNGILSNTYFGIGLISFIVFIVNFILKIKKYNKIVETNEIEKLDDKKNNSDFTE